LIDNESFLNLIYTFQRCQRNWNLEKTIDDHTIDYLLEVGYNVPTKQNLNTFKIVCIKNRKEILKWANIAKNPSSMAHHIEPLTQSTLVQGQLQNPQVNANLLFLFFVNENERTSDLRKNRERGNPPDPIIWKRKCNLEIGLSASVISIAAILKGYRTGFCGCIDIDSIPSSWVASWGVRTTDLAVMLGVGLPLHDDHTLLNDPTYKKGSFQKAPWEKIVI